MDVYGLLDLILILFANWRELALGRKRSTLGSNGSNCRSNLQKVCLPEILSRCPPASRYSSPCRSMVTVGQVARLRAWLAISLVTIARCWRDLKRTSFFMEKRSSQKIENWIENFEANWIRESLGLREPAKTAEKDWNRWTRYEQGEYRTCWNMLERFNRPLPTSSLVPPFPRSHLGSTWGGHNCFETWSSISPRRSNPMHTVLTVLIFMQMH